MATIAAVTSKLTARRALARVTVGPDRRTTGYRTYTADSGTTTTAVVGGLSGIGADYIRALPWAVNNTDASVPFEFRRAINLDGTTITFANAFGAAIATSDELDFYPYRPSVYTEALNRARSKAYPRVYRYLTGHVITSASRGYSGAAYSVPRSMRKVDAVKVWGHLSLRDAFDRAASASDPGSGWTAASGDTFGVDGEELYCVSGADGDYVVRAEKIRDGYIEFDVRGVLAHNANYRTITLMFRNAEDYLGAWDNNNGLRVRLLSATTAASGGVVDLRKVDAGTETSLTTAAVTTSNATNYVIGVEFTGARVKVWVDGVALIDFELTGANAKYVSNAGRWGFRHDEGGTPGADSGSTAARVGSVYAFTADKPMDWPAWRQQQDEETVLIPPSGRVAPTGSLLVEGIGMLSAFSEDSAQALVADTTNVLEIPTDNPAWETYIQAAKVALYEILGYDDLLPAATAVLDGMPGMKRSPVRLRHAMWA